MILLWPRKNLQLTWNIYSQSLRLTLSLDFSFCPSKTIQIYSLHLPQKKPLLSFLFFNGSISVSFLVTETWQKQYTRGRAAGTWEEQIIEGWVYYGFQFEEIILQWEERHSKRQRRHDSKRRYWLVVLHPKMQKATKLGSQYKASTVTVLQW